MENEKENEAFSYTYSAKQQKEVKEILRKYISKEESAVEKLRRLDRKTERPGMILSLTSGIIGTLLLGVGMCCTIEWKNYFAIGVAVGIIGIALVLTAYPIFRKVTEKQRKKIAPQIIELSEKSGLSLSNNKTI